MQVVARVALERRGGDHRVQLVREVAHARRRLGEDRTLDLHELLQVLREVLLVLRHHIGQRLALDELAADRALDDADLEDLGDRKARLRGTRLIHRLVQDRGDLVVLVEDLEDGRTVLEHLLVLAGKEHVVLLRRLLRGLRLGGLLGHGLLFSSLLHVKNLLDV